MADPDESLQPVYREPLGQEGFDVVVARTGLECVARLRERVPDVLVLEPQLPWGGGEGVLAIMGEVPELADGSRDGAYLVPRSSGPGRRVAVSDQRLPTQTAGADRLAGKLHMLAHPSQTAFHSGGTRRPPGMCDRATNRRPGPGPARRGQRWACHRAWPLRLAPRQAIGLAAVLEAFEASESPPERVENGH